MTGTYKKSFAGFPAGGESLPRFRKSLLRQPRGGLVARGLPAFGVNLMVSEVAEPGNIAAGR